uniref:Uncharacterized protein n=1 Tax=Eutreptiella gymnastica TaxID=73025 RepID=A0A7S1J371_9EUGL|mmetsp:Transcript_63584/g.113518  ORF Transcript_63584/g.113518 Transcript_63584/m.113518 type:complete len:240 (+) Transcript_63584:40-759(+)
MAEYPGLKSLRLTPEEMERSISRLSRGSNRVRQEPEAERKIIKEEDLGAFFERNYTRQIAKEKKKRAAAEQNVQEVYYRLNPMANPASPKRLGINDELTPKEEDYIERMYNAPRRKKDIVTNKLEQKYLFPSVNGPRMARDQLEETTDRLFRRSKERKETLLERAHIRVYGKPEPRKILTAEEMQASSDNLYAQAASRKAESLAKIDEKWAIELTTATVKKLPASELANISERLFTKGK